MNVKNKDQKLNISGSGSLLVSCAYCSLNLITRWYFHSSEMLCSTVSWLPTFRNNLSVPSSRSSSLRRVKFLLHHCRNLKSRMRTICLFCVVGQPLKICNCLQSRAAIAKLWISVFSFVSSKIVTDNNGIEKCSLLYEIINNEWMNEWMNEWTMQSLSQHIYIYPVN